MSQICTRLSQSDDSDEKKALVFQIIAEIPWHADEDGAVVLNESLFEIRKITDEVDIVNRVITFLFPTRDYSRNAAERISFSLDFTR